MRISGTWSREHDVAFSSRSRQVIGNNAINSRALGERKRGERGREEGRRRGFFPTARYRFSVIPIGAASLTRYSNRIRLYRAIDVPIVLEGHSMSSSLRGKGPRFPRYDSIAFDPVKRVRFDPSKSNFFRSTVFPHLPFFPLGIRTSPNYLDSSRTRYSRYNWCSLCPRFVFVAISRWMDEKYDELLERINWLTMIERFIDIFFFFAHLKVCKCSLKTILEYSEFEIGWEISERWRGKILRRINLFATDEL